MAPSMLPARLWAAAWLCACLLHAPVASAQIAPLHDTGQTTCYDMDGQETPCSAPGFPGFDARFGRDAAAADGVLPKAGGGTGGFDFTKVANDGGELPPEATLGSEPHEWACTQDNHTGLLWEIKISDPSSPRHYQWGFGWFNPDGENNGGNPGHSGPPEPVCGFTLECNTHAYVEHLNEIALCGRTDWRMPTLEELSGIVNFGSSYPKGGAMDRAFFADGGGYSGHGGAWTADTGHEPEGGEAAWYVNFDDGHAEQVPKGSHAGVRLVSGELPPPLGGEMPVCGERENRQVPSSTAGAFHLDEPGLARDERTGLTWARCAVGQEFVGDGPDAHCEGEPMFLPWQEAMQMVLESNEQGYLGYSDWRLPNVKELQSMTERQCFGPVVDLAVFPEQGWPYWTSTSSDWHPEQAWAIEFSGGNYHPTHKHEAWPGLRLVRGGAEFDDYEGGLSYSVGGHVHGLLGSGLGLRLDTETGETESITIDADGPFVFAHGFSDGEAYAVTVEQAPVPHQSCTVENGSGTVSGGNVEHVEVVCAEPEPARIELSPAAFDLTVYEEGSSSGELAITNAGGGFLDWSLATAFPGGARGGVIDCEAEPGIIIHDDGTPETAYSGNQFWADGYMIVDRFTPESYPASISSVCLALAQYSASQTSVNFEIVVLADNGPGGSPGTVLGAMAVTASDLPPFSTSTVQWYSYDLSSFYTTIEAGSVYVGVRFPGGASGEPAERAFLLADHSDDRPVGYAGGYYWNYGQLGEWTPIQETGGFDEYRALFVRAVEGGAQEPPVGCDAPSAVPWLSLGPTAGSTPAGETDLVALTVNGLTMDAGTYEALLCLSSNDPENPRVEVPVSLTVHVGAADLVVSPDPVDFGEIVLGGAEVRTATITNVGTLDATVTSIEAAPGAFTTSFDGEAFELGAGESTTVDVTFTPTEGGLLEGTLSVSGHDFMGDEATASASLSGTGLLPPEAAVSPASLALEVEAGQMASSSLVLSNEAAPGALDLSYSASVIAQRPRRSEPVAPAGTAPAARAGEAVLARADGSAEARGYTRITGAPFAHLRSGGDVMITHSASQAILPLHGIACASQGGGHTTENSFWRVFDLADFPEVAGGFSVTAVEVGVESMEGPALGTAVRLYTLSGAFETSNLTLVGEAETTIPTGTSLETVSIPVEGSFGEGDVLVVEWHIEHGEATGSALYPGTNDAGETAPTYISAASCNIEEPATYGSIGFDDVHLVMNVHGTAGPALLSVAPTEGDVAPQESEEITLTLDATSAAAGSYAYEVLFATNDPERPTLAVPVSISISGGMAILDVSPNPVDFEIVFVGDAATQTVTLTNEGTAGVTVTSIEASPGVFTTSFDGEAFGLGAGESTTVDVTFTPTEGVFVEGVLNVFGHDAAGDEVGASASLWGAGLLPAQASVSPESVDFEVEEGQTASSSLVLSNEAEEGALDLNYSASVAVARPRTERTRAAAAVPASGPEEVALSAGREAGSYAELDGAPFISWRQGEITLSHSASLAIDAESGIGCAAWEAGYSRANQYYRVFDLAAFPEVEDGFAVAEVDLGVWIGEVGGGLPTTQVRLHTLSGAFTTANLTLVAEAELAITEADHRALATATFAEAPTFSANDVLVVEWAIPDGIDVPFLMIAGFNGAGQTGPTYLRATECGANEPTDLAVLGFPEYHWALQVRGTAGDGGGLMLSISPEFGGIAPQESEEITLTLDASDVAPGDYAFEVVIQTSDPERPTLSVPVAVTVTGGIATEEGALPLAFSLSPNYPNPFSGRTTIEFALPEASPVKLSVFDASGRLVATLVDGEREAGFHEVAWEARGLASGVYLLRLEAGSYRSTQRMVLVQ